MDTESIPESDIAEWIGLRPSVEDIRRTLAPQRWKIELGLNEAIGSSLNSNRMLIMR